MPKETTKSIGLEGKSKAPDFRRGNNYVLCIGIDDYEKQPLHNCVRDVKAFTQVLIERYDFKEEHITYLLNREATREEINDRLRAYADLITEEDNFLLYYSGHGKFDKLEDEGYWLTYGCDFKNYANKGIANQEMVRKIKTLKARHIVLFIDSCFSGSLFFTDKDLVAASPPDELEKDPSRWAITAGRNEPVSDGQAGQHSPFTKCVINYFLKDNHQDGRFSISELVNHVKRVLPANHDQSPDGRRLHKTGDQGGQFVFYLKTETKEQAAFNEAMKRRDIGLLEDFLDDFEKSRHKTEVKKLLKELAEERDWATALKKNTIVAFDDYIENHPSGLHTEEARRKKRELREDRDREAALRLKEEEAENLRPDVEEKQRQEAAARLQRQQEEIEARQRDEAADNTAWKSVEESGRLQDWKEYLQKYPNGLNAAQARKKIKEITQADEIASSKILRVRKDLLDILIEDLYEALNALNRLVPENSSYKDKPVAWLARLKDTNKQSMRNTLSREDLQRRYDTIRSEFFDFLDDLKEAEQRKREKEAPPTDPFADLMVHIKGGTFDMGDTFGDGNDREQPVHRVTVKDFYLCKYPVTQAQWKAIMGDNPSHFIGDELPVESVSWDDTQTFIEKLNEKTGKQYRLPSEAEWEYAAREGGKKVRFGNGKDIADPKEINFAGNELFKMPYSVAGESRLKTTPVTIFTPNVLDMYDMSGNVWEWCEDVWHNNYNGAPDDGSPWTSGAQYDAWRVIRGGGYYDDPNFCRATFRDNRVTLNRHDSLGFRLAQ